MENPLSDGYWARWHGEYDTPGSPLSRRLALVQGRLRDVLQARPAGEIRVLSMCAGQGRDLLGVLAGQPRRDDVRATLVELDPGLAAEAEQAARAAGLRGVRVLVTDAGAAASYADAVPVDLALVCGVFGNITAADIRHTVTELPRLCRPGATVIWTRHRRAPDLTPAIRSWFADAGFDEVAFDTDDAAEFVGVGTHRLSAAPQPYRPGARLFAFVGNGTTRPVP